MYSRVIQNGKTQYGVRHYVVDSTSDIADLPLDTSMGSTAFVIETGDTYMLNGKREWTKIKTSSSSSSSGSGSGTGGTDNPDSGNEDAEDVWVIYDGGDVTGG